VLSIESLRGHGVVLMAGLVSAGCPANPYVIGEILPRDAATFEDGGMGDARVTPREETFVANFSASGATRIGRRLEPPGVSAELVYRGEGAGSTAWPAEIGPPLGRVSTSGVELAVEAPFTDATRAVRMSGAGAHYRAAQAGTAQIGTDDIAIELVFRSRGDATLLQKSGAWRVAVVAGRLVWEVGDRSARSFELGRDAWHACWLFLDRRADELAVWCNAQPGEDGALTGLGVVDGGGPLEIHGGSRVSIAYFAWYRTQGGWGDARTLASARFFALTGVLADWAAGSPLPASDVRSSVAYLDLARDPDGPRRLHRVGPHWPRVACRTDVDRALGCGYLSEGGRRVWLDVDSPQQWTPQGVTVSPDPRPFLDEEPTLWAIRTSSTIGAHQLVHRQDGAADVYTFSVFVVAGASDTIGLSIDGGPLARYDLTALTTTGADTYIEDWGGGFRRCIYVASLVGGRHDFRVHFLDPDGAEAWSAPGVAVSIAGLEVLPNRSYPATPIPDVSVDGDRLAFTASGGNLPTATAAELRFQVLHPAAPRRNDGTLVRLFREQNPEAQLDLYISAGGHLQSAATRAGTVLWAFGFDAVPLADRRWHEVRTRWSEAGLRLDVDGTLETHDNVEAAGRHLDLDQLLVGQGTGTAEGLLRALVIRP
jgi:hypothetical protein